MLNLKYTSFLESKVIELITESKLFFSPRFRSQLSEIDDEIAKELISTEDTDVKPDITFVDDGNKEGYLSFITMRNASKLINKSYPSVKDFGETGSKSDADTLWEFQDDEKLGAEVYRKSRNILKIGKFINSVFPDKFTSKQIEEFVNKLKSHQDNNKEKIQVVEGEDINFWYDEKNYLKDSGNLGGSCMRYSGYGERGFFELYVKNPDVCRLLILTEGGKLKGRALIWKIDEIWSSRDKVEFEYFVDRQYTSIDSDVNKLINYAVEQGWAYKTYNSFDTMYDVTYDGNKYKVQMTVEVKAEYYDSYPFMDTFRVYDPNTGILKNSDGEDTSGDYGLYKLDSTGGSYSDIEETGYYSSYHDEHIPEDEAVYSERVNSYIRQDIAIDLGRRGWYPNDHEDIRFSERNDDYYHEDDVIWSEHYEDYILYDDSIEVVDEIWDDGETVGDGTRLDNDDDDYVSFSDVRNLLWYEKLSDKDHWENYAGIMKELLTKNYNDKWILKKFEIEVYPTKDTKGTGDDVEYLLPIDAYILQEEIDKEESITMDKFEYHQRIEGENQPNVIDKIKERAKTALDKTQLEFDFDDEETKKYRETMEERIKERMQDFDSELFD